MASISWNACLTRETILIGWTGLGMRVSGWLKSECLGAAVPNDLARTNFLDHRQGFWHEGLEIYER